MKIGVISDTHGIWRPEVDRIFHDARLILHAGDVGRLLILDHLGAIAPVVAVRGNVDDFTETSHLPSEIEKEICGVRFLMRHVGSTVEQAPTDLKRVVAAGKIGVFVFGHSHRKYARHLHQTLFFNPGAAGPRRFSTPLSVATLEICDGKVSWKFWELEG